MISDNLNGVSLQFLCDQLAEVKISIAVILGGQHKLLAYHNICNKNQEGVDLQLPITVWNTAVELEEKMKDT